MIELYIPVRLGRKIARLAKSGNQSATKWVLILIPPWFGGEILGFVLGAVVGGTLGGEGLSLLVGYAMGLAGALGAQGSTSKALRARVAADQSQDPTKEEPTFAPPPVFEDS